MIALPRHILQNDRNRIDNNRADLISEDIIDEDVAVIIEEKPGVRQNKPPHHFPHDFSKPLKSKQFLLCLPRVNASVFHADEYISKYVTATMYAYRLKYLKTYR